MNSIVESTSILVRSIPGYPEWERKLKKNYISLVLQALGPCFEPVSRLVPECREELSYWEEGRRFALGVLPNGPAITIEKRDGRLYYLGTGMQSPDVSILFKNLDAGMMAFTLYIGTVQAAAENRVITRGDNGMIMEAVRILDLVEFYLFPSFIAKRNFRRAKKFTPKEWLHRVGVYLAVVPAVVRHIFKKH